MESSNVLRTTLELVSDVSHSVALLSLSAGAIGVVTNSDENLYVKNNNTYNVLSKLFKISVFTSAIFLTTEVAKKYVSK
jgi:hypothetical protein